MLWEIPKISWGKVTTNFSGPICHVPIFSHFFALAKLPPNDRSDNNYVT